MQSPKGIPLRPRLNNPYAPTSARSPPCAPADRAKMLTKPTFPDKRISCTAKTGTPRGRDSKPGWTVKARQTVLSIAAWRERIRMWGPRRGAPAPTYLYPFTTAAQFTRGWTDRPSAGVTQDSQAKLELLPVNPSLGGT